MSAVELQPPPPRMGIGPMVVGLGLFMQGLDGSAIATALPTMARSLGTDPVRLNLAISSYLLAAAVFIPASGWFADRFGARRVFCAAMALFALSSVLCGLSQAFWQLVVGRVLQGMAGAMMVPVGRLIVIRSVPREQLVRAWTFLTIPGVIGPVLGPALGGLIATAADWRWIFFINLPIGLAAVAAGARFIPKLASERPGRFDLPGFVLVGASVACLVFALHELPHVAADPGPAVGLIATGVLGLAVYPIYARRAAQPILDLGLLQLRTFRTVLTGGGVWRIAMGMTPVLTPLLLQVGFGLDALTSGLLTLCGALGALTMKGIGPRLLKRFGFRNLLVGNAAVAASVILSQALFTPQTPHAVIAAVLFVTGSLRSLQLATLSAISYSDVPAERMSRASAFGSMAQELWYAVGAAMAALVMQTAINLLGRPTLDAQIVRLTLVIAGLVGFSAIPLLMRLRADDGAAALPRGSRGA